MLERKGIKFTDKEVLRTLRSVLKGDKNKLLLEKVWAKKGNKDGTGMGPDFDKYATLKLGQETIQKAAMDPHIADLYVCCFSLLVMLQRLVQTCLFAELENEIGAATIHPAM